MGLTFTMDYPRAKRISRRMKCMTGNVAFDSSYPTGGELANDSANGLTRYFKSVKKVDIEPANGYIFKYDLANHKIKAYVPVSAANTSVVAGANNTIVLANSVLEHAGAGAGGQIALTEVANTANLANVTPRFAAFGY